MRTHSAHSSAYRFAFICQPICPLGNLVANLPAHIPADRDDQKSDDREAENRNAYSRRARILSDYHAREKYGGDRSENQRGAKALRSPRVALAVTVALRARPVIALSHHPIQSQARAVLFDHPRGLESVVRNP